MLSTIKRLDTRTRDADFTRLVGLLVAMLIIGLLATIVIPGFSGQQAGANHAAAVESDDLGQTAATMDAAPLASSAPNATRIGCYWFDTSTGTITGYGLSNEGCDRNVVIPSEIDGSIVRHIGNSAFSWNDLTSVTIPNTVTSIANDAFAYNNLTSVTIPDSVTSLGSYAFDNNNLSSVTIGNSVESIEQATFADNNLASVTIPNSVESIGIGAFERNNLSSVTIGSSVGTIEGFAFSGNNLTAVTIPNSVESIGSGAFQYNSIGDVKLPAHTTYVESGSNSSFDIETVVTRR